MKKILVIQYLWQAVEKELGILRRADVRLLVANSAEDAIALHRKEKTDLIIVDLDMPGMPGDELCSLIRQDGDLKKVSIIIACNRRKTDIERCARCGANSYIRKPIDAVEMRELICNLLDIPERKGIRVLIKVSVRGHFQQEPFFCTSQDISKSGILLETDRALAKGDVISCSFFIPDAERAIADGEVMRVAKKGPHLYQYGIRFINLSQKDEDAIEEFVRKNAWAPC